LQENNKFLVSHDGIFLTPEFKDITHQLSLKINMALIASADQRLTALQKLIYITQDLPLAFAFILLFDLGIDLSIAVVDH
jgi:uncharacterized protein YwgA